MLGGARGGARLVTCGGRLVLIRGGAGTGDVL